MNESSEQPETGKPNVKSRAAQSVDVMSSSPEWFSDHESLAVEVRTHLGRSSGLDQIPGYEIHERISRGGQGTVYAGIDRARATPVAVKILRNGIFSSEIARRRFEREVEVLSDLQHDNIVSALEFGTTDDGLQYLVMPRIEGQPLDVWAKNHRENSNHSSNTMGIKSIVQLFVHLCETVHFAHQHGVIHRDLKPGNVLIDKENRPNVLDFGLAKLFDQRAPNAPTHTMTQDNQFVGSVQWTSPEQLAGDSTLVDVRTDIYSLGVLLYQALTGQFPYRVDGALSTIIHNVMSTAPKSLSTMDGPLGADLDSIALKALAKSSDARYQSAGELAHDLRSFLDGEPIRARRERARHTLQRNVRRYQMVAIVSAALIGVIAVLYMRAARDRDIALIQAAKATASAAFLEDMLADIDPRTDGLDVTVRERLDKAASQIPIRFADQPEVAGALEYMIATAYGNLGLGEPHAIHMERAWRHHRNTLGPNHLDTLDAEYYIAANPRYADAHTRLEMLEHVVAQWQRQLGPNHRNTLQAELSLVGMKAESDGNIDRAVLRIGALVERATAALPSDDRVRHKVQQSQLWYSLQIGDLKIADAQARAMLALLEDHPDPEYEYKLAASQSLAHVLLAMEKHDEVAPFIPFLVDVQQRVLGEFHPATATTRIFHARWLIAIDRLDDAEKEIGLLSRYDQHLFTDRIGIFNSAYANVHAEFYTAQGKPDQAIEWLEAWIAQGAAQLGADQRNVRHDECLLVTALAAAGRCDEAVPLAQALLVYFTGRPIADHTYARLQLEYGECLLAQGNDADALLVLDQAHETLVRIFPLEHSLVVRANNAIANVAR